MIETIIGLLNDRGVTLDEITKIVLAMQTPYSPDLTMEECDEAVYSVLGKREVQYAILTGIAIDQLAEARKLPEPLQGIIDSDEPLYGIDEILAMGIANIYGSIGITTFGFLDKEKVGVIGELDNCKHNKKVNTFLDDLVAGIAAAASAKIAHQLG